MFSEIKSAGLFGLNAFMVTVQASIAPGQPSFDIVGMPDIAVQESKAEEDGADVPAGVMATKQYLENLGREDK